jgi:putative SOS response-associated peptidase YedK
MCGRFFRHSPRDELAAAFRAEVGHSELDPGYNVAPGQPIITVRFNAKTNERSLEDLRWGLIPFFAKDPKIAWRTINARGETIDSAPLFRRAFEKRRCLIAVDGFFEWKAQGKKKKPYAIALPSKKPFALAGLWEGWQEPETGEWIRTCTIVTTDANEQLRGIHERMPVILNEQDYAAWLGEEPAEPDQLKSLLKPYEGELSIWPVSARVNKPNEAAGPELLDEESE